MDSTTKKTLDVSVMAAASDLSLASEFVKKERSSPYHANSEEYPHGWALASAVVALNATNAAAFVDQFALVAVLPKVSRHFGGDDMVEWATTIQLIGATVGQALLGYLSDTWSRRTMLLVAVTLMALSSFACGASHWIFRAGFFVFFRCISGVAIVSISNLVNIAQNDILPPRRRMNFQGIQGISVASASIFGLVIGSVFAERLEWYHFYWLEAGMALLVGSAVFFCVQPHKSAPTKDEVWSAVKSIDYIGIASGSMTISTGLLLLCKLSTLGTAAIAILASASAVSAVIFVLAGFKNLAGVRPIVPFGLFRNRTILAIYAQNIFFGATFYSYVYFMPITLQVVRGLSPIEASAWIIPYFVTHGIASTASAQVTRKLQDRGGRSFSWVFLFGFGIWTLAMVLLGLDSMYRYGRVVIFLGVLIGLGTGSVFQNSVMAICSQVDKESKAVAVGTRNVLRSVGGAMGTAISSAIIRGMLRSDAPKEVTNKAFSAVFDLGLEKLSGGERKQIQHVYGHGHRSGVLGLCGYDRGVLRALRFCER